MGLTRASAAAERAKASFIREWLPHTTRLPWSVAHDTFSGGFRIVGQLADGRPRCDATGRQIVVASGLTQPDAFVLVALREFAAEPAELRQFLRLVDS